MNNKLTTLIKEWPFDKIEAELRINIVQFLPNHFCDYLSARLEERKKDLLALEKKYIKKFKNKIR